MTSGCKTETGTPRVDSMTESCDSARHDSLCLTRPAGARRQSRPVESGPGNNTPRPATACPGLPARSRIEVNLFIILSPPPERPSSPRPRKASEQCQSTQLRLGLRQPSTSLGKPYSWEDRVPGKKVFLGRKCSSFEGLYFTSITLAASTACGSEQVTCLSHGHSTRLALSQIVTPLLYSRASLTGSTPACTGRKPSWEVGATRIKCRYPPASPGAPPCRSCRPTASSTKHQEWPSS